MTRFVAARDAVRQRASTLSWRTGVELVEELPAMGTAVPVIMSSSHRPAANLPAVGSWIKLKVVGQQVVEVSAE